MSNEQTRYLESEARRFREINKLLSHDSPEWKQLHALFENLRAVYPPNLKGPFWEGRVEVPETLEKWVNQTADGDKPRPDYDDLNKMRTDEVRHPGNSDSRFYLYWKSLIDKTEEFERLSGAPAADGSGPGAMPPSVPVGKNETHTAPPPAGEQIVSAAPRNDARNDARREASVSPPSQVSRNTAELSAIRPVLIPVSHRSKFDTLTSAAGSMMAQRKTFHAQLTAMQQWLDQYWLVSDQLVGAANLVANTEWVSPEDYQTLRQHYDALGEQNRQLRENALRFREEAQRAAKEREVARQRTADLLIKQAQGLWKQLNVSAESEKRHSEHDRSLAMQVYLDLLRTLHAACAVDELDVRTNDRFDPARMVNNGVQKKTKEKQLLGCVAWVEEPGFQDEAGVICPAKVAVYSGE